MKILGADPGLANFGVALVEFVDDDINVVAGHHITTEAGTIQSERLGYIQGRVGKLLWPADAMAMEDCSAWGAGTMIKWVFAAQQRAEAVAWDAGIPCELMRESKWKQVLGLPRTCSKGDTEERVRACARVSGMIDRQPDAKRNHIMDAAAIAIAAFRLNLFEAIE